MFWGLVIENGKRYHQIVESSFHISKACGKNLLGSYYLTLKHDKQEFVLCCLNSKQCQQDLNLNFTEGEDVEFFITEVNSKQNSGSDSETSAEICLSGFYSIPALAEQSNSFTGTRRTRVNGHGEMNGNGAESELISVKKRSLDEREDDDDDESSLDTASGKMPKKKSKKEQGDEISIADVMKNLNETGHLDDEDDEDFNASSIDEEASDDDAEEDDDELADDDEDDEDLGCEDIEEDELAGLKQDMDMSLSELKLPRKSAASSADNLPGPSGSSSKKKTK